MRTRPWVHSTLLAILAVIIIGWCLWQVRVVQERKQVKAMLTKRNLGLDGLPAFTSNNPTLPWYRVWLGDSTTGGIYLDGTEFSQAEIEQIKSTYPEIDFLIVGGSQQGIQGDGI